MNLLSCDLRDEPIVVLSPFPLVLIVDVDVIMPRDCTSLVNHQSKQIVLSGHGLLREFALLLFKVQECSN